MKVYPIKAACEEAAATIAARTSRSSKTFAEIAEEVAEQGHAPFLETNVLGYGHDSVAEGAMLPWIAIEDISDLAGNIIATSDPQLRVQMSSTRYQKMEGRNVTFQMIGGQDIADHMMEFTRHNQKVVSDILKGGDYKRKLTLGRDISRGFMPAGIKTQLSIRHDARGMRDVICFCLGHPLDEVKKAGELILESTRGIINTLLDRHITPVVTKCRMSPDGGHEELGTGMFNSDLDESFEKSFGDHSRMPSITNELIAWRDSAYRRRMRINACPEGPFLTATITSDYGAYRDLRRNRTIHQEDLLPNMTNIPDNKLWAFKGILTEDDMELIRGKLNLVLLQGTKPKDPYLAPMNSIITWRAGGHFLNWAYMLRLRSNIFGGCHPAYALPMLALMEQIHGEVPDIAAAMGIEDRDGRVDFVDRF